MITSFAVIAVLVAVTPPAAAGPIVAAPTQAGDGLTSTTSTVYEVDPEIPEVRVTTTITISNAGPFVYSGYSLPIFSDARSVSAGNASAGSLSVIRRAIDNPAFQLADMTLSPLLAPGQTQTLVLRSVLPALPARGEGFARVNGAYVTFPVVAVGDPGRVDVRIVVPPGFEWTVVGTALESTVDIGGVLTLSATAIEDPEEFFATVAVFSEDRLSSRVVESSNRTFDVLSWPDDDIWSGFVADVVERGIPGLEEGIGVPMPGDDDMRIIETFSPYLYGYAGWYIPDEGLIEIGDELDGALVLHELAHVWFNNATFRGRWINEGLSELFAVETAGALGLDAPVPIEVDPADPLAIPLNEWATPNWLQDQADERERWGYDASFWVLQLLHDDIGLEGVRDVVSSALEGRDAYGLRTPDPDSDSVVPTDWRALLDLLEEVGGSTQATDIFDRFVVTDLERRSLDERRGARTRYLELVERRTDLDTPPAIRTAMSRWRFDNVDHMVDTSLRYLDRLDAITTGADALGLTPPAVLVDDYEAAEDFVSLHSEADRADAALRSLESATEAADSSDGLLVTVGGWFLDPAAELESARGSFERGAWDTSAARAVAASEDYDRLDELGLMVLGGAVLLVAAIGGVAFVVVRVRRRPRGMSGEATPLQET